MKFEGKFEGREISPRAARIEVAYDVLVRHETGEVRAQILNLSGQGFRIRLSDALEAGSQVTLEVANLPPVKAIIRWASEYEAGGVFVEPVAL